MFQGENYLKDNTSNCKDVKPTQTMLSSHENSVNVDNDVTDCDNTEVIITKPLQSEPIQGDMTTKIINIEEKQLFEDKPVTNGHFKEIPTKENEGIVLNNMQVKKNFFEIVDQFKRALQSPITVKREIQNVPDENVITSDITDESKSIDVNYNNATQSNKGQGEKSNDILIVPSNTVEVVQCQVDGNVTNKIKDENEIKYYGKEPSPIQTDVLNESKNVATILSVNYEVLTTDESDGESTPKRSRQFTFSDSDLPNDDEIKEILMLFPKPKFIESFSDSESEFSLEEETIQPISRRLIKHKPVDITKMFESLPIKILTRLRKKPVRYGWENDENSIILKPTYLTVQEDQIDADIIVENIKRFNKFRKGNTNKHSIKQHTVKEDNKKCLLRKKSVILRHKHKKSIKVKSKRKNTKSSSKSDTRKRAELRIKNRKKDSLDSVSAAKTTTKRTRFVKDKNDGKNTQHTRILLRNRNKKTDSKQKETNETLRLVVNKVRQSKRLQKKVKVKRNDTVKTPKSMFKKNTHEQNTVINSPSNSESPKRLKRSLVDRCYVRSSKRMRKRVNNANNNQEPNSNNSKVKKAKTLHGHLSVCSSKELMQDKRVPYVYLEKYEPAKKRIRKLDSNRNSLKMKTRAQAQSDRRSLRSGRTRDLAARS